MLTMAERRTTVPSTAELRALVRAAERTPGRDEALAELVSRQPRDLDRFLTTLALDPGLEPSMRLRAVVALGRRASTASLDGLRAALQADDETVTARAVERLGKVGRPEKTWSGSGRCDRAARPASGALRTAKCFLSYRHRLGEFRIDVDR
jgi:hypothetical protein